MFLMHRLMSDAKLKNGRESYKFINLMYKYKNIFYKAIY